MDKNISIENLSVEELLRMKKTLEQGIELPNLKDINLENLNLELLDIDNEKYLEKLYELAEKTKNDIPLKAGDKISVEDIVNKEENKPIK